MRNLRNIRYDGWSLPSHFRERSITAATWDLASDSVLCTLGPSEDDALIELVRIDLKSGSLKHALLTSWEAPCPNPNFPADNVVNLHFFGENLSACLVLAGGDIIVVREEPLSGEDRIEIIGSVDAGITAAAWSPDEELLAITTKEDTVIFMSRSFEGITDVSMTSDDLKASNHVSVGWGKKETQFKGKGAKALRDPTMPEKVDEGVLSPNDDSRVNISWRGDGAYLAISTIQEAARRIIRVYSREGILDSVSEPVDGLEGALSWRPAGNLISGIQRLKNRVDVVFFERNGLRHGQFSLRLTAAQMAISQQHISLAWNSDSTVLAVIMDDCIQCWTMGNYHWYLKQEIGIKHTSPLSYNPLIWHPENPLRFATAALDSVNIMEYIFTTARGSTTPPQDQGVVAVIDGQLVKLTAFAAANIPPPMALDEVTVDANVKDVAFNGDASLVAVLHQKGISVFGWPFTSASSTPPTLRGRFTFEENDVRENDHQQICFSQYDVVLTLQRDKTGSLIKRFGFSEVLGKMEEIIDASRHTSKLLTVSNFHEGRSVRPFAQDVSGNLHDLAFGSQSLSHCKIPMNLPWIEITHSENSPIAFGMSANGHLYANSRLLVKNCTSFIVTPAHLIFTTTAHLIKFVHITNVNSLEVPPDDPESDERCRSIERGARLVTAMPTSASLVLQMPRGNLETINPRAMVVAGIRGLIDEKNYKKAFTTCRTQRVDMNILYDHAPDPFLSNVPLFIDQLKKITYIDLFLSSLREDDVTQSMYKDTRVMSKLENGIPVLNGLGSIDPKNPNSANSSKINKICDAFLDVLKTRTATNLQNVITANVCKSPPALQDGLLVVSQLMKEESNLADKAVEHICFLADVNILYEKALGLYNLDLALLVAQKSQKDPREYLPFLQNLQEMTSLRRRFSIDDFLGRHTKALSHLHALDVFSEFQKYTQKHSLYQAALALYRYKPSEHAKITELYAEYLESKSSFKEAALAFESLPNYARATSCYLCSGPAQWRETLFCALSQIPPLSGTSLTDLATSLYDALIESKDYFSAGAIQIGYLSSIENAASIFCKGYFFADAMHLVASRQRLDLLKVIIDPGLAEALASSTELLAECKAQLNAQVPRIQELRAKALADPFVFYEGERVADGDVPDDVSVAASSRLSTNRSLYTRYTGKGSLGQSIGTAGTGVSRATSKNRRREDRKRARGKKGSVYEEEYLIASVGRLIDRVESVRGEVGRLVTGLVRRGMWERAKAIEGALAEVVSMCQACLPEVFGTNNPTQADAPLDENGCRPIGANAVLQESIEASWKRKEPPLIATFERLSLLGT